MKNLSIKFNFPGPRRDSDPDEDLDGKNGNSRIPGRDEEDEEDNLYPDDLDADDDWDEDDDFDDDDIY